MMYLDTDDAKPASSFTYGASLAATQASIKAVFLGIAMNSSASGETHDIAIKYEGQFEMDCAAATFEVGDELGGDDNGAGDTMLDQQVIAAVGTSAYFTVVKRYASNTTRVLCAISDSLINRVPA